MRVSVVLCVMIACGALTHATALSPPEQSPLTNGDLRVRVEEYLLDASAAERDYGPIGEWDTSEVTDMDSLFSGESLSDCKGFNADIGNWDVSRVTDMRHTFAYCHDFNQDLNEWDVSNVSDFSAMFQNAKSFNGDITGWTVNNDSHFTNFGGMFHKAESFDQCLPWAPEKFVARETGMFRGSQGSGPKCGDDDKPQCSDLNRKKCKKRDGCFYSKSKGCIDFEPADLDTCLAVTNAERCIHETEGCQWLNRGEVCVPLGRKKAKCDFYDSEDRCELNRKCTWDIDHCTAKQKRIGCDHGHECSEGENEEECSAMSQCVWGRGFCDVKGRRLRGGC